MQRSLAYLGDAPATPPALPAPPASAAAPARSGFATIVLFGGVIGGAALAIVGGVMGQHRLLTEHVFKKNRRSRRRS